MEESSKNEPFCMYLGGEGGTGKTRVIEALLHFAKMWDRVGAVRSCGPTGIAASLVRGQTFHSLIGLRGDAKPNTKRKPTKRAIEEFAGFVMLIVDEVSMMGRRNIGALNCYLR